MQTKLDEEESKNMKLQQHINKLEHHSAQIQEVREQYAGGLCVCVTATLVLLDVFNRTLQVWLGLGFTGLKIVILSLCLDLSISK